MRWQTIVSSSPNCPLAFHRAINHIGRKETGHTLIDPLGDATAARSSGARRIHAMQQGAAADATPLPQVGASLVEAAEVLEGHLA